MTMNGLISLLFLLLWTVSAQAGSLPWRRIPALETFSVTTCLGDPDLFWVARSKEEQRNLFTPEFYEKCNSGSSLRPIWPCCKEGESYHVLYSPKEVEKFLDAQRTESGPSSFAEPEWKKEYMKDVEGAVDFKEEALVLISHAYGPTGMAKAKLHFKEDAGTLTVRIEVTVPPPPLTPDTALFRFAFAVDKSKIERVEVITDMPEIDDLRVTQSRSKIAFPIKPW